MARASETLDRLLAQLGRLPGIGPKSAERIAFHLLRAPRDEAMAIAIAIRDLKTKIRPCSTCNNPTERDPCPICTDPTRDKSLLCVVEQPKDLMAVESTGAYDGLYYVLMGRVAPLDGEHIDALPLDRLRERVKDGVREVILATNPDTDGDATALHVARALEGTGVRATRIAKGIPSGSALEYANASILTDALSGRREVSA